MDALINVDKQICDNANMPAKKLLCDADELFNTLFKICYFEDTEYSVSNETMSAELVNRS